MKVESFIYEINEKLFKVIESCRESINGLSNKIFSVVNYVLNEGKISESIKRVAQQFIEKKDHIEQGLEYFAKLESNANDKTVELLQNLVSLVKDFEERINTAAKQNTAHAEELFTEQQKKTT